MPPKQSTNGGRQQETPAMELASANATTSLFLGKSAKSWMTGAAGNPSMARSGPDTEAAAYKRLRLDTNKSATITEKPSVTREDWSSSTDDELLTCDAESSRAGAHESLHTSRPTVQIAGQATAVTFLSQPETGSSAVPALQTGPPTETIGPGRDPSIPTPTNISTTAPRLTGSPIQGPTTESSLDSLVVPVCQQPVAATQAPPMSSNHSAPSNLPPQAIQRAPQHRSMPENQARQGNLDQTRASAPVRRLGSLHEALSPSGGTPLDRARLDFLQNCAHTNDLEGLLMHQLFMVRTHYPSWNSKFGFRLEHENGMMHLEYILGRNDGLTPSFSRAALIYPDPCHAILEPQFRPHVERMKKWLALLSCHWQESRRVCHFRNVPPSPMEIVKTFDIVSPQLQIAVFTALIQSVPELHAQHTPEAAARFKEMQVALHSGAVDLGTEANRWRLIWTSSARALPQPQVPRPSPGHAHIEQQGSLQAPAALGQFTGHSQRSGSAYRQPISDNQAAHEAQQQSTSGARSMPISTPRQIRQTQFDEGHQREQALLPPPGLFMAQAVHPHVDRVALHQAHLREPVHRVVDSEGNAAPNTRLYAVVKQLVSGPQALTEAIRYSELTFAVDEEKFSRKVTCAPCEYSMLLPGYQTFKEGSLQWRLRCISCSPGSGRPSEDDFSAGNLLWPEHLLVSLNDNHIELRRKAHYGKCLPAYLNSDLKLGTNVLAVSYERDPKEANKEFWIAVELVVSLEHGKLRNSVERLSAESVVKEISHKAKPIEDDELVIAGAAVSIDMTDPFTALVWKTPVRSKHCKHKECFDLDTFLDTRPRRSDGLYTADEWKCPICRRDARPGSLIIDLFMEGVRNTLERQGKLESVRAILVRETGEWEATESDNDRPAREQGRASTQSANVRSASEQEQRRSERAATTPAAALEAIAIDVDEN